MRRKQIMMIGTVTLALGILWQHQAEDPQQSDKVPTRSRPGTTKVTPFAPQQDLRPEKRLTDEDRIERLAAFYKKLDKIHAESDQKAEIKQLTKPPVRQLIKEADGTELIEITYEDGGKSYLPNTPRLDMAKGAILPKEF